MNGRWALLTLGLLAWVPAACGGGSGAGAGLLSGQLTVTEGTGPTAGTLAVAAAPGTAAGPQIVAGEIVVRFRPGLDEAAALRALLRRYAADGLTDAGAVFPGGPRLLRSEGYGNDSVSRAEAASRTLALIERLRRDPAVAYAQPNHRATPKQVLDGLPGGLQSALTLLNVSGAWALGATGAGVVVAVLDTGIRPHPDLDPVLFSDGFNFVSDPVNAANGVGRSADPTEPLSPLATFHGTHVAGIVAARRDGFGTVGVAPDAKVLPIRVLGVLGGDATDLVNGLRYAAGLTNVSGRPLVRRADVANLSLGGDGPCPAFVQETIDQVRGAGLVVVVAAGNEPVGPDQWPASCTGVITVGAAGFDGRVASYSAFKSYVDLLAPGGEGSLTHLTRILSTIAASPAGEGFYRFQHGTSMSAPHAAGVAALMLEANTGLRPDDVERDLKGTARLFGQSAGTPGIGTGLVDAAAAVARVSGPTPPSIPPVAYAFPPLLAFNAGMSRVPLNFVVELRNVGHGALTVTGASVTSGFWLSVSSNAPCSVLDNGFPCLVTIRADVTGLPDGLRTDGKVTVETSVGPVFVPVVLRVGPGPSPFAGPVTVRAHRIDVASGRLVGVAVTETDASRGYRYRLAVAPGEYLLEAGLDLDGSGLFGDAPQEQAGAFGGRDAPLVVVVAAGESVNDLDFAVVGGRDIIAFPFHVSPDTLAAP